MATKTSTKSDTTNAKKVKDMEKTIEDLKNMVALLMKGGNTTASNNADRDVVFISLCTNTLNLSTEPYGGGVVYTFNKFGEEQVIPYSDARLIIRNNKRFITEGKCYIADDDIIQSERLTKDYQRVLNKTELLDLLNKDRNAFSTIFDNMTKIQKETLRDIVVERLIKDKTSVDMNIVQALNEALNTDILRSIEDSKGLLETNK